MRKALKVALKVAFVAAGIRSLHRVTSMEDYMAIRTEVLPTWPNSFQRYVSSQWLDGPCSKGRSDSVTETMAKNAFIAFLRSFHVASLVYQMLRTLGARSQRRRQLSRHYPFC